MKLKNFLLGSLCMIATTASAQLNGTGYYVVKSNSGKYLSVEGNTSERVNGNFKDLKLNDAVNSNCVMYITVNGTNVSDIKVGNISALSVIANASNLGNDAAFAIEPTSDGKYTVVGTSSLGEVHLKENANGVGTSGSTESGIWEIIPYNTLAVTGDADANGSVTSYDIIQMRQYMIKKAQINLGNADINGDGSIKIDDINAVKTIILNQD